MIQKNEGSLKEVLRGVLNQKDYEKTLPIIEYLETKFSITTLLIIVIESVFGKVMCDARFWKQIAELRADRLAINVCKSNKMTFVEFWKTYLESQSKEETNIIDQFYRRYIKVEGHPSMERRMELIEKREKWSWWEYFEHALVIMKWRVTNKGWNGI